MRKLKTKGAAKKRLKLTGSGKIKRASANHSHILTKKSSKRKRHLSAMTLVAGVDEKRMRKMLT
jgi:large subunit ribosomal protein L35